MAEKEQTEKEPSIEEILESIRQIISDDGSGKEEVVDNGAGKLDLSGQAAADDIFKDAGAGNLSLSGQDAADDIFKDAGAPAGGLDLSAKATPKTERAAPSASGLDLSRKDKKESFGSNLDLSQEEEKIQASSDLDLSSKEKAQSFSSSLDLSQEEDNFKPKSDLDLSQEEEKFNSAPSNLDLSTPRETVVSSSPMDFSQRKKTPESTPANGEVFDLTNSMKVGVADTAAAGMKMENDSLLSEQSASAASAELAKLLATNIAVENEDLNRVGKVTLEDMVMNLMRPLIKEWLDKNLPLVIERVVKREIEKISQRALDR